MGKDRRIPEAWAVQGRWLGDDAPGWLKRVLAKSKRKRSIKKTRAQAKRKIRL